MSVTNDILKAKRQNFKKVTTAKTAIIRVSPKSFRGTLKRFGVDLSKVAKGATKFTITGKDVVNNINRRVSKQVLINPHVKSSAKRFAGLQSIATKVIVIAGKQPNRFGSQGKLLPGELIPKTDYSQFRNFGLRADGTPRLGYTLAQCAFSVEYRRAGERGSYDRYGVGAKNPNQSVLNRVRGKFGLAGYVPPKKK